MCYDHQIHGPGHIFVTSPCCCDSWRRLRFVLKLRVENREHCHFPFVCRNCWSYALNLYHLLVTVCWGCQLWYWLFVDVFTEICEPLWCEAALWQHSDSLDVEERTRWMLWNCWNSSELGETSLKDCELEMRLILQFFLFLLQVGLAFWLPRPTPLLQMLILKMYSTCLNVHTACQVQGS